MTYTNTINDVKERTSLSEPYIRKCLNELENIFESFVRKGDKNKLLFDSNAMILWDQIKQYKEQNFNLPEIKNQLEKSTKTHTQILKQDTQTLYNNESNIYIDMVISELKTSNKDMLRLKDEIILEKDKLILELNKKVLLLTDGKSPEEFKKDFETKQEKISTLEKEILKKDFELKDLGNTSSNLNEKIILKESEIQEFKQQLIKQEEKEKKIKMLNQELTILVNKLSELDNKWFVSKQKKEIKYKISQINIEIDLLI